MIRYLKTFKMIISHKAKMFIELCRVGLYRQAITHDIDKLKPRNFINYAKHYYGTDDCRSCTRYKLCKFHMYMNIDTARLGKCEMFDNSYYRKTIRSHKSDQKHHWEYWRGCSIINKDIPGDYVIEMLLDWKVNCGGWDNVVRYYIENYHNIKLDDNTRIFIEEIIGIFDGVEYGEYMTIRSYVLKNTEEEFNKTFESLINKFNFDLYNHLRSPYYGIVQRKK